MAGHRQLILASAIALFAAAIMLAAETGPVVASARSTPPAGGEAAATHSPVDTFRMLLAMKLSDRKQFLTNRPPEVQKRILAKVREYESLRPEERELRLRTTELRWHLLPLMSLPPSNRVDRLNAVPDKTRALIEDRLRRWDQLPPTLQQELLSNEQTADYFAQLEAATSEEQRQRILSQVSPERRAKLQARIDRWRNLSPDERQKMLGQFSDFFELSPHERAKTLNALPDSERQRMEKVLESYASLTPEQRAQCLRSFGKFAGLGIGERLQFLRNAERWKRMTPAERDQWRTLVTAAPLDPRQRTTPYPPGAPPHPAAAAATN